MSRRLLLALAVQAGCVGFDASDPDALACTAEVDRAHPDAEAVGALLDARVREGLPGIQLTVDRPGEGAFHGAAGSADLVAGIPLEPCHLTRAGSIDKTVTAVVVLQLVEEGAIGLDDPLSEHLPAEVIRGIANADRATIRQALQHATGIPNWIHSLGFQTASLDDLEKAWSADELLDFARRMPPMFEPGDEVRYSNTNTLLLGLLIEERTRKPLAAVFEDRVFAPLGLQTTRFAAPDPVPDDIIRGYIDLRNDGHLVDSTTYSGWDVHADGGLLSNAAELAVLMRAATDGTLVPEALLDDMLATRAPAEQDPAFFPIEYGLGVFRMETDQGTWWFHSGDAIGYQATAMVRQEDGVAVAWAVNGNYGTLDRLSSTKEAFEEVLEVVAGP